MGYGSLCGGAGIPRANENETSLSDVIHVGLAMISLYLNYHRLPYRLREGLYEFLDFKVCGRGVITGIFSEFWVVKDRVVYPLSFLAYSANTDVWGCR